VLAPRPDAVRRDTMPPDSLPPDTESERRPDDGAGT
jgi:hypothetical protein